MSRTWQGAKIPPELETLPHATALRIVQPLPTFARAFQVVWCGMTALMCIPLLVDAVVHLDPAPACFAVPLAAGALFTWTRPRSLRITFRPGTRWVTFASPTGWAARPMSRDAVAIDTTHGLDGWPARLHLSGITLAITPPGDDRDGATARLLPLANALRREMGGDELPGSHGVGGG